MIRIAPFAVVLAALFGVLATLQPVSDSDLFWHLATGRQTIAGDLPRVDTFSWTIAGAPVLTDQWLGDALLALSRAVADWRGVLALRALAVAALVLLVVDAALAARPMRPIVAGLAALPAIALSRFAWTDRPELLGLVGFALLIRLLRGGDRGLLASVALLFVWAQLHGSYALGFGLILAACGARAMTERRERWRFVPIASFAVLATLLTPAGLATWTSSGGHFLAPPRYIAEEGVPDARTLAGAFFLITLALLVATAMLSRRTTLREAAILIPVAFVALTAERHTPFLAIAAAPYFASHWPDPLARWRPSHDRTAARGAHVTAGSRATETLSTTRQRSGLGAARGTRGIPPLQRGGNPSRAGTLGRALVGGPMNAGILAAAAVALLVAVARAPNSVDQTGYPQKALAALPRGSGVMNQYDWGGYLITFAPETPVFIDGRLFPYVPDVLNDYRAIVGAHPGWEDVAQRRGVRAMLVRPTDAIAVRAPEVGWHVAYADDVAVVLTR